MCAAESFLEVLEVLALPAQLHYTVEDARLLRQKNRKPLFDRTSSILGCKQAQKGVIWRNQPS